MTCSPSSVTPAPTGPVWLAGASAGGGLALDAALATLTGSRAW